MLNGQPGNISCELNVSKTVGERPKLLLMANIKLHVRFRLLPRSVTLGDLELL